MPARNIDTSPPGSSVSSMDRHSAFEKSLDSKKMKSPFAMASIVSPPLASGSQHFRVTSNYSTENGDVSVSKVSAPGETIKSNNGWLSRLRSVLSDNKKSIAAENLAKPKEAAKTECRVQAVERQREYLAAEARISDIVDAQQSLMAKVVVDVQETIREEYSKQMKDEVGALHHETLAARKNELEAELTEQLKPKVIADLEAQWEEPIKEELVQNFNAKLQNEFTKLQSSLRDEVISDLRPAVIAKLREELTEPVIAILKEELAEPIVAKLRVELTEPVMNILKEDLADTVKNKLEERFTEPVMDMLKKRLATKAQTEFEADLENSAKTELKVLAEKAQKPRDELERQDDREKEGTPLHQGEEYDAYKPVYHTKSIDNNIHPAGQQNDHEKGYDSPPHQSEEYRDAAKPAYYTKSAYDNIHVGEQQDDRVDEYSPQHQSEEYDTAKPAYHPKSAYDHIRVGKEQDDREEDCSPPYQSEEYNSANSAYLTKSLYTNIHPGKRQDDREVDSSPRYRSKEDDGEAKTAYDAKSIHKHIHLSEQLITSPEDAGRYQPEFHDDNNPPYQIEKYDDAAAPAYPSKFVHSNIHLGEQPTMSPEDTERYHSEDCEDTGAHIEHDQSYPSLQYNYEERSVHKNKHLYPITGNGSSFTGVQGNKRTQVVSPSGGMKHIRDEHEDDEGDRWGSSPRRTCDGLGTSEKFETQYSSPPQGIKRMLDEDDRWGPGPKRSRGSTPLFLTDDEADPLLNPNSPTDEEQEVGTEYGERGFEEGEYDEMESDYSSEDIEGPASDFGDDRFYPGSQLPHEGTPTQAPKYSGLGHHGSSLDDAIDLGSDSESDIQETEQDAPLKSSIGEDDLPDYESDDGERP